METDRRDQPKIHTDCRDHQIMKTTLRGQEIKQSDRRDQPIMHTDVPVVR